MKVPFQRKIDQVGKVTPRALVLGREHAEQADRAVADDNDRAAALDVGSTEVPQLENLKYQKSRKDLQ